MPNTCLVEPSAALISAADLIEAAVDALNRLDADGASRLLASVDEPASRAYWNAGAVEWGRRHDNASHTPIGSPTARNRIPAAVRRGVVERDGWRCRYCGLRLLAPDVIVGLNERCPDAFPWGSTEASMHAAGLVLLYTPDHVVPRWGGGTNDLDNLVAACGTCNYMKWACTIEELGLEDPRHRAPVVDGWNGLSGALGVPPAVAAI